MGGGIRRNCGRCYSTKDYDMKLKVCKNCGWSPNMLTTKEIGKYLKTGEIPER